MQFFAFMSKSPANEGMNERDFREIFDNHFDDLRRFLYYKSKDMALAEDMAQDAFVKLWEKRAEVRIESAKTLLFTIGNNLMINSFKKEQHHITFINQKEERHEQENPEFILEQKQFKEKLEAVINDLPEGSRVVFLMNRIDGKKYAEIAETLGIGIKAVEKRMSVALKQLRAKLPGKI